MNDEPVSIGLDLGTGSVKAVALSRDGRVVGRGSAAVRTYEDQPGEAEQSLDEVWSATQAALGQVDRQPIEAIALSGAMHSVVALDANDEPIGRATTWADARGADELESIADEAQDVDALYRRTGCPNAALYHLSRLRWHCKHRPDARRFTTICDWIAHRLTGRRTANLAIASATGLVNLHERDYDEEALALAHVDRDALLALCEATTIIGRTDAGSPIVCGASDGALANLAADPGESGELVITVGTSAATRRLSDSRCFDAQRRAWCYIVDESWYLPGAAMNSGGDALRYVADQWFAGDVAQAERAAGETDADCGGITVLPFVHGERDLIWPHDATWVIEGEPSRQTPANIARATMLSVAACVSCLVDVTADDAKQAMLTGGITRSPLWMGMLADMAGLTLRPIDTADASAIGAAMVGWRAMGCEVEPADGGSGGIIEPGNGREAALAYRQRFIAACRKRGWMAG